MTGSDKIIIISKGKDTARILSSISESVRGSVDVRVTYNRRFPFFNFDNVTEEEDVLIWEDE